MKKTDESYQEPQPINADEFMWAVIAATPAIMREISGVVNVDMRLSLDETGRIVSADVVRCNTIVGRPVKPDQPEIVQAAEKVVRTLRFQPARRDGQAVCRDGFDLSFGFTTTALEAMGGANRSSCRWN